MHKKILLEEHFKSKSHLWRSILFITVIVRRHLPRPACVRVPRLSLLGDALLLHLLLLVINVLQSLQDVKREVIKDYFT